MDAEQKFELITKGTSEITNVDKLRGILSERDLKLYWGTATTGMPHIAYFNPILKLKDFQEAGCEVKILLADVHAFLDNQKAPIEKVEIRTVLYEKLIKAMLKRVGVEKPIEFVRGSSFQTSPKYTLDLYKLATLTTVRNATHANSEVVKKVDNPLVSSMIYPLMQALDEEYLSVDAQFGGLDQRKIFMFAKKFLPKIGYKERIHLMNPMQGGLNQGKMSSSDENSKISLLESEKTLRKKINKSFCEEKNLDCGLLVLLKNIVFPLFHILGEKISCKKSNTPFIYSNYEDLEAQFETGEIHPADLKEAVYEAVNFILKPIRDEFKDSEDLVTQSYGK